MGLANDQLHAYFTPGPERILILEKRPFQVGESDIGPGTRF